jgi:hypothetical protein
MADRPDPFETLKQQGADMVDPPLPAAEVRTRGDRMRRRRTAFRAVAAAAAVAVITTGGVALGGGLTSSQAPIRPAGPSPQPSPPSPSIVTTVTEIPADFPIAAGIAVTHDPAADVLARRLQYCGEQPLAAVAPVDAVSAQSSGGETSELRTLLLFDDEAAAADAQTALLESAAGCPEEVTNVVGEVQVLPASDEWPGRTIRTTYGPTSAKFVHVVRAGAGLLLTESYLRSAPQESLGQSRESVLPLVAAMEQFETTGDLQQGEPEQSQVDWRTTIPANFPLALGYPEDRFEETELIGPAEDLPAFRGLKACGHPFETVADETDRLAVTFNQPEDSRARKLTLSPSDAAAHENLHRLVDLFRSCPREDLGLGGATLTEVREIEPGDEGFVIIRTYEQDGMPMLGMELIYAARVGNALLLQSTTSEGGGGNEKQIYASVREQTRVVDDLAEEMCVFSTDGC